MSTVVSWVTRAKVAWAKRLPITLNEVRDLLWLRDLVKPPRIEPLAWDPPPALEPIDCLVVMAVGAGMAEEALDTLDSIETYLGDVAKRVVIVDDHTTDGTAEALASVRRPDWHVVRNDQPHGLHLLSRSLGTGYKYGLDRWAFRLALRIDVDALVTGPGLMNDALAFSMQHPETGVFGQHTLRSAGGDPDAIEAHVRVLARHDRRLVRAWYHSQRVKARANGWTTGESVFGGGCFFTRPCLVALRKAGVLDVPVHSRPLYVAEDVYFSMCAVAAGFELGHFAAPVGPLAMAWRELPFSPEEITRCGYKLVHSVDKGRWAATAREHFRAQRAGT
jgi:hypothetical protein